MSKIKGLLKGSLGVLKIAGAFVPFVLAAGGAFSALGTVIGYSVNNKQLISDYTQSPIFIERSLEDMNALEEKYNAGEIDYEEYGREYRNLISEKYIKEMIKEDIEGNQEYQERLKSCEALCYSGISLGCCALAGMILSPIFLYTSIFEKIYDSGEDDLKDAKREFSDRPKKQKQTSIKRSGGARDPRVNDSEKNQDKEKTEIENKVFDDANDNGDHLGSLDDFLDQYK